MNVRVRFAPSPTGFLHIGGLRTALYNFLFARHHGGVFVLRIEDTDRERHVEGATEHLIRTLHEMGLDYDEGPGKSDAPYGPYIQSERKDIYRKHIEVLLKSGEAYHCFCTQQRLEQLRETQRSQKRPTKYDRACLNIPLEERYARADRGEKHVIRLHVPDKEIVTFTDIIRGEISISSVEIDDQVLLKSDGMPTYHLANVVDDHLMEITHVIRGEEWISSTPKHCLLYRAFGWDAPPFAHLPLLLNENRSKLSKRQGDVSVEDFLSQGYLPQTLLNFVALLGWNPSGHREKYGINELIPSFDIEKINKSGAVVNRDKLDWLNKEYIGELDENSFVRHATPFLEQKTYHFPPGFTRFGAWVSIERERIKKFSEVGEETSSLFVAPAHIDPAMLVWKKSTPQETIQILKELAGLVKNLPDAILESSVATEAHIKEWIKERGYAAGNVLWPLRVALSGKERSPGPFELLALLGKERGLELVVLAQKAIHN